MALLALLNKLEECHLSAADVFRYLENDGARISLATVYNNLNEFADIGFLRRISCSTSNKFLFDTNTTPHHHIIDRDTGTIRDTDWIDYVLKDKFPIQDRQKIMSVEIIVTLRSSTGRKKRAIQSRPAF